MILSTPYQLHWQNLAAYQAQFEAGDTAAITLFAGDVRGFDEGLSQQEIREALRALVTDPDVVTDLLARHMPKAIASARSKPEASDVTR